jgi:hypothetical protein
VRADLGIRSVAELASPDRGAGFVDGAGVVISRAGIGEALDEVSGAAVTTSSTDAGSAPGQYHAAGDHGSGGAGGRNMLPQNTSTDRDATLGGSFFLSSPVGLGSTPPSAAAARCAGVSDLYVVPLP